MKARTGVLATGIALASAAHAADLRAPAPSPSCFASLWSWLDASASDCPLTYAGVTLYGALDVGATELSPGAGYSPSADKLNYFIQKNAYARKWLPAYNALSISALGLKMKEELGRGWSLVGARRGRRQPVLRHVRQRPALAGRQQPQAREHIPAARLELRLEPSRSVGQFSGLHRFQQSGLRDADLRPHERAVV